MGYKASFVLINRIISLSTTELITRLGGGSLVYERDSTFEDAIYPDEDELHVGFYKDNTVICDDNLPLIFYDDKLSRVERNFIKLFPKAEILALSLNSFNNFYGYALIKQSKKVRVKIGDCEVPVRLEVGEPLPEENKLYDNSVLLDNGSRLFRIKNDIDTDYSEDAIGEEFVFEIAKRFLGDRFDSEKLEELMFDTVFYCYRKE